MCGELSFRTLNGTMTCVYETWDNWCAGHKGKRTYTLFLFFFRFFSFFRLCLFLMFLCLFMYLVLKDGGLFWWFGDWWCDIIRERNASDERCTLLLPILLLLVSRSVLALVRAVYLGKPSRARIPRVLVLPITFFTVRFCCVVLLDVSLAVRWDLCHDVMKRGWE